MIITKTIVSEDFHFFNAGTSANPSSELVIFSKFELKYTHNIFLHACVHVCVRAGFTREGR